MIKTHKHHKNPEHCQVILHFCSTFFSTQRKIVTFFLLACLLKMYILLIAHESFSFIYYQKCPTISRIVFRFGKASERFLKCMRKIQKYFTQPSARLRCFTNRGVSLAHRWGCCQACSDHCGSGGEHLRSMVEECFWKLFLHWNRQQ